MSFQCLLNLLYRTSRCTTSQFECCPNNQLCYMMVTCQQEQRSSKPLFYNCTSTRITASICGCSVETQRRNTIRNTPFLQRHDDGSSLGLSSSGWKFRNTK